jgi:hypothetical protein
MYGSPVKEPGALSPLWADHAYGGGDDDRPSDGTLFGPDAVPLEVTPLPKIPIFVLSICMLGEFLSASVCSPFLFLYVTPFLSGLQIDQRLTPGIAAWWKALASVKMAAASPPSVPGLEWSPPSCA